MIRPSGVRFPVSAANIQERFSVAEFLTELMGLRDFSNINHLA